MERTMTKVKKSIILFFVPAFLLLMVYYLYTDQIQMPYKTKFIRNPNLKYILQWTDPNAEPFVFMRHGQEVFLNKNCPVNNCYITADRAYMNNLTDFDAILFHGPDMNRKKLALPMSRALHQRYVFVSMESAHYYPIYEEKYDNFFNWTWTYKLNSDLYMGYIVIRNKEGDIIGPRRNMHWLKPEEMDPIDDAFKVELSQKQRAVAWFVSNCQTPGKREKFVKKMAIELQKYKKKISVFGKCGYDKCPKNNSNLCNMLVKQAYYFYLSFENSFSEDYVTEKLLTALLNNAIPIVFGGANYTRFLPDGAYLDARKLGVEKLVEEMIDIMNNTEKFYNFFRWRNHYSYHYVEEVPETNYYCRFCRKINENITFTNFSLVDPELRDNVDKRRIIKKRSFYKNFRRWWNNLDKIVSGDEFEVR